MAEYKVVGLNEVFGTPPGETFSAELNEEQEAYLTEGGHIKKVEKAPKADLDSPKIKNADVQAGHSPHAD